MESLCADNTEKSLPFDLFLIFVPLKLLLWLCPKRSLHLLMDAVLTMLSAFQKSTQDPSDVPTPILLPDPSVLSRANVLVMNETSASFCWALSTSHPGFAYMTLGTPYL